MKNFNTSIGLESPSLGKYRRMGAFLTLFALFFAGDVKAQGACSGISFDFPHYEPCKFRATYSSTSDCFTEIRYQLESGQFLTWSATAGFTAQQISPSEIWVRHTNVYLPVGDKVPLLFTLAPDLNTNMLVAYNDTCAMVGCDIFGGIPITSCPDPQDASIIGVKYRECGNLPYTNQTTIPGWPIQLLDADGNLIEEQVTDANGNYAFYDRPLGVYLIKEDGRMGWTPKVPASGQYTVDLAPSQQVVRNFGNCPECSCDSIYMDVVQLPFTNDTCTYTLSSTNSGAYCFNSFNISISSGSFASVTPATGWTAVQLDSQHVQLDPPDDYLANGICPNWVIWTIAGSDNHQITVSTSWDNDGVPVSCSRAFSFQCPPPSSPTPCCPAGSSFGNELVTNGDFELGNQSFSNSYTYFNPGNPTMIGKYSVLNQSQVFPANSQWACSDHTIFSPTGKMLVIDGFGGNIAWEQTISVVAGTNYAFSAWVNNLLIPTKNSGDPQMALFVGNTQITSTLTLPEAPDQWVRLCATWIAPASTSVTLSIRMLSTSANGNDVAIDDVSVRACIPTPVCETSIQITPLNNCGLVQVMAVTNGPGPISYQWCDGQISQTYNTQLTPCVPVTFCVDATCSNGNMASANLQYTASDQTPPVALCNPGIGVDLGSNCSFQVSTALVDGGSSDNCGIQSMSVSPTVLTACTNTIVTLTVTDWCGNTSTCTMGIQTTENVPPMIVCPQNLTVQGNPILGGIQITMPSPLVLSDNCNTVSYVTDRPNGIFPCGEQTAVVYTAIDPCMNTATCTMTVTVENCEPPDDSCCAFALHLINNRTDGSIKYVKVTGQCDTKICCADPGEWEQVTDYPQSVIWRPVGGSPVPTGNAIDNDFLLYLSEPGLNNILVEWFDQNDVLVCQHIVQMACDGMYDEEMDFSVFTSTTALNDPLLFCVLVREESEDDESECEDTERELDACSFTWDINCSSPNYLVTLHGPPGYSSYSWTVVDGPSYPSISNSQDPTFLGTGGGYVILMTALDAAGGGCTGEEMVVLPEITPNFTYEFAKCPTNTKATVTATGCDGTCTYAWTCTGVTGFPTSGNPVTFTFPVLTTTYPLNLIMTDQYGCQHSITDNLKVDLTCKASFEVESYFFCPDQCVNQVPVDIAVTIKNTSTGGICPINYDWDFGNPNTPGNILNGANSSTVSHTYKMVDCPDGEKFTVKLTAREGNGSSTCKIEDEIEISPCHANFTYIACPDGKVIFEGSVPGEWSFPGSHSTAPWPVSDMLVDGIRQKPVVRYDASSAYQVVFVGHCKNGGRCEVKKEIEVVLNCCAKNDVSHDKEDWTDGSTTYRLKSRFVQRQLPLFHRIKATSKFFFKKNKPWFKRTIADNICASFNGTIYTSDTNCNCKIEQHIPPIGNQDPEDCRTNAKKAKIVEKHIGRFRSRTNSMQSTHTVTKGTNSRIIPLWLGKDCDKFRWWTDWF